MVWTCVKCKKTRSEKMKRKLLVGIMIGLTTMMTSCQTIEKAVEETFATQPQKLNVEEKEDKNFLDKVKDFFFDESNDPVFILDIISDAEDKIGFEFSTELDSYFKSYLLENEIQRYLSEEEVIEIVEKFDENNFILNPDKRDEVMEELFELVGTRDFYIYEARFRLYDSSIYIYIVNPDHPEYVDLYYYNSGIGSWHIIPEKLSADVDPRAGAILLSDIDFENFNKIMEVGTEILKEIGDYREFNIMNNELGINMISTHWQGEDLVFKAEVKGVREDYNLTFDAKGNLIEKERK